MARIAAIYLVSVDELQRHVGCRWTVAQLEFQSDRADMERIALATTVPISRLIDMTFTIASPRYRQLVRGNSRDQCPICSGAGVRQRRLKAWTFAFSFWCHRHGQPLQGPDRHGANLLDDTAAAKHGAALLLEWAMDRDDGLLPIDTAVSMLLSDYREPARLAPWELARLSRADPRRLGILATVYGRRAVSVIVREFDTAVPIYEQRLPRDLSGMRDTSFAERYALAIGITRLLRNPPAAVAAILAVADAIGRERIMAAISAWPSALRKATERPIARTKSAVGRSGNRETTRQLQHSTRHSGITN